jgi:hypothetical protein
MEEIKNLILTEEKLIERRVNRAEGIPSAMFYGKMEAQESGSPDYVVNSKGERLESTVVAAGGRWVNSEGYSRLWGEIEDLLKKVKNQFERKVNINQFPDDYYDLIDRIRIDITRRRIEQMDMTGEMTNEITNPNFSKSVDLTEFIPFAGAFEEIKGTGDNVPMLQQKTGAKGSVGILLYGLGHARILEDELYNLDIYSLEKVNAAVARGHTALRNDLCLGTLVRLSNTNAWDPSQQVIASTVGTLEERVYTTINNAIYLLGSLLDPQTDQEINTPRIVLIVGTNAAARAINRSINGRLRDGDKIINLDPLEIDEVWNYKGDVINVGPKSHVYPGVPRDRAYLIVPGPAGSPIWTLNKRQLTMEIGRGDVLQLARERRAWYFGQGNYMEEFLGSSGDYSATLGAGYGFCVEIILPEAET